MPVNASIIEKAKKLLALADPSKNSSAGERDAAMSAVHKLMTDNKLDMAAILSHSVTLDIEVTEYQVDTSDDRWVKNLLTVVAEYCDCSLIFKSYFNFLKNRRMNTPFLIGTPDNTAVAYNLFDYLSKSIKAETKPIPKEYKNSFRLGAVHGVYETVVKAMAEQRANKTSNDTALMVVNNKLKEANEAYKQQLAKDMGATVEKMKSRTSHVNGLAYAAGAEFGNSLSLNRQISGAPTKAISG